MSYDSELAELNIINNDNLSVIDAQETHIEQLKSQIVDMRKECNRRFSEQLQKIRKLEAEKMLQIQDTLFEEGE